MNFIKWVKSIQTAGCNGARMASQPEQIQKVHSKWSWVKEVVIL